MPDLHSLADRLYYANRREYTKREGNVAYLDGTPLKRPLSLSGSQLVIAAVIVIVAIGIGAYFVNSTVLASMREAVASEQAVENNLARQGAIETLPVMTDFVGLEDEEIKAKLEKEGFTMFDASDLLASDDMVLYRLPDDLSVEEATAMFATGINGLSAADATKLLNGSWSFVTEREGATSMVTRYADFTTGNPEMAVRAALEREGFDSTTVSDEGVDESGNTYKLGTVEVDDKAYSWKISALPLSEMYSISKLPEEACYIGVRVTAQ